jgi:hypothetical protein
MADKTTEIKVVAAPEGYEKTDYQFFLNSATGQLWKAAAIIQPAHSPIVNGDVEAAPTQLAVQISVSPVDKDGKALREDDKPVIIDVHAHTFTHVEMSEDDFDPMKRMLAIVAERIHIGEARLKAATKIRELGEAWSSKAKLKFSGSFSYIEPEAASEVVDDTVVISPTGPAVTAKQPLVGFSDGSQVIAPTPQNSAASEAPPASETEVG